MSSSSSIRSFEWAEPAPRFPTPENKSFRSKRPYKILDPSHCEIRLLRVHPHYFRNRDELEAVFPQWTYPRLREPNASTFLGVIACELLENITLATVQGQYSALSYCAGEVTSQKSIIVDGIPFNAFANLEHAIKCVIEHWNISTPAQELLLWVDQICINQFDDKEKSHQVAFMRRIYEDSRDVYVCLSTFESVEQTNMTSLQSYSSILSESNHSKKRDVVLEILNRTKAPIIDQCFSALEKIALAPWWSRAWVFQEFILPSRCYLMFQRICITYQDILPFLDFYCQIIEREEGRSKVSPSATTAQKGNKPAGLMKILCTTFIPKPPKNTPTLGDVSYQLRKDKDQHALDASVRRVRHFIDTKTTWSGSTDIRQVLRNCSNFKSSDPRDLIYAFIGLANPRYGIEPDYSPANTMTHLMVSVARRIIEFECTLHILDDALLLDRGKLGIHLPSWVPNWTSPENKATQECRRYIRKTMAPVWQMKDNLLHFSEFSSSQPALQVRGRKLGILSRIIQDHYKSWKLFHFDPQGVVNSTVSAETLEVCTNAAARAGNEVWAILGTVEIYILREVSEKRYVLIGDSSLRLSTAMAKDNDAVNFSSTMTERGAIHSMDIKLDTIYLV